MFEDITLRIDFANFKERISEEQLYKAFAKQYPNKRKISSPFRIDKHPSFQYYKRGGRIFWRDQATGESGDIYDYIRKDQTHLRSFQDVLFFINEKLFLGLEEPVQYRHVRVVDRGSKVMKNLTEGVFMQVIRKKWNEHEYTLWNRWAASPEILKFYHTYAASQLWKRNEAGEMELLWIRQEDNPIFFFHFPRTKHIKAYRPLEKDKSRKFIGNATSEDIQGYEQCDIERRRPHLLVLTKAMKECMFFRAFGINAIAKGGENHRFDPDFISYLRRYCGLLVSLYDNDPTGIHGAWQLRNDFDIPAFFIPKQLRAKNITDLYELNKPATWRILKEITEWNSYRRHFRSYRNLLRGDLQNADSSGVWKKSELA